jgi:putative chitinase
MALTEAELSRIMPGAPAAIWAEPLNIAMNRFAIATPEQQAMFLAQIGHESDSLRRLEENLNYSAEALARTWARFSSTGTRGGPPNELAQRLARDPVAIATEVYSGRMGNGPPSSGDGWSFRGRGPLQITGRDLYRKVAAAIGYNVEASPDLLFEPIVGALSAAWVFMVEKRLGGPASIGDIATCTLRINGGMIGIADREARYNAALGVLA